MQLKTIKTDKLTTNVYDTREEMGKAAAECTYEAVKKVLAQKEYANIIFAAAPSQNETLKYLLEMDIDFSKINAFHMDEYVGLGMGDKQSFQEFLTDHIFGKANFNSVKLIPAKMDIEEACASYAELLEKNPPDIVLMGIGENGHIAFNDPPVADFNDKKVIKAVMQQVHDGCFPTFDDVPEYALTLTVPTLMSAKHLICTVPGTTKAEATYRMLNGEISTECPATILRNHEDANMFLDKDSASML